jgi:hypothetical protein
MLIDILVVLCLGNFRLVFILFIIELSVEYARRDLFQLVILIKLIRVVGPSPCPRQLPLYQLLLDPRS